MCTQYIQTGNLQNIFLNVLIILSRYITIDWIALNIYGTVRYRMVKVIIKHVFYAYLLDVLLFY